MTAVAAGGLPVNWRSAVETTKSFDVRSAGVSVWISTRSRNIQILLLSYFPNNREAIIILQKNGFHDGTGKWSGPQHGRCETSMINSLVMLLLLSTKNRFIQMC